MISQDTIAQFKTQLENHPIYDAVSSLEDLQIFMQHHVYSVWDFMSLIKYLQSRVAPTMYPWVPQGDPDVRRFINELVLEEESDERPDGKGFTSHFELYQHAMKEIGADTSVIEHFIAALPSQGIQSALALPGIPTPSTKFTGLTFSFIEADKPHQVAAALALGREHIIPCMFRSILSKTGVTEAQAPIFHWYLNRHIHLDEDFHAPLSLRLLNGLCQSESDKEESIAAADQAVNARLAFWDGVLEAIESSR